MPSHVRIFWWLSVAAVTYWVLTTVWFLAFPTAHYLSVLAKLPSEFREDTRHIDVLIEIASTLVWSSVTVGLAWLAAYRRLNWARWAFVIIFLVHKTIPFAVSVAYRQLDSYIVWLKHENWASPSGYVISMLTVAAIVFVFSGNARGWFHTTPTA